MRDHVGQGYGKTSQCLCTSVFHNAETPCPRVSCVRVFECEVRVFECEMSTYLVCRGLTSPGLRKELCHSPNITSQVHNQSPIVISPTGPVERELFLGPNVGFHALAAHRSFWGFGEKQASVAMQTLQSLFISSRATRSLNQCCMTAANQRDWVI